jgi:hypothetical protein
VRASGCGSGRLGVVALMAAVGLLLVSGGSALATTGHNFAGQFGGLGNGDGQFGEGAGSGPVGLAVMPSTGEVFTADLGQGADSSAPRIQRFSAEGAFQARFVIGAPYGSPYNPIAVDPAGSGAVYLSSNRGTSDDDPSPFAAIAKYNLDPVTGAPTFAYELNPSGSGTTINNALFGAAQAPLAVDPVDGTVYAAATITDPNSPSVGAQVIDRFSGTTGAFIDLLDGSGSPEGAFACPPSSLAVDGSHRIYVLDPCKDGTGRVDQFSVAGVDQATLALPPLPDGSGAVPSVVATDPTSGEVYVAHTGPAGMRITHFSAGGASVVHTFDVSNVGGVQSMAVSGTGTVYTSDATKPFVERFTRFAGPTVVTGSASSIEGRSEMLEGTIDPVGVSSSYHFEYGTDPTLGSRTPEVDAGNGTGAVAASAQVDGLEANKPYYFRLVGSNASGSITGAFASFTTLAVPPTPDGSTPPGSSPAFASAITPRGATLHGTVNPNNNFGNWQFEYGTTTTYGGLAPQFPGSFGFTPPGTDQRVATVIAGLEPDTLYHFRVVGTNFTDPPQLGADQTFFTSPEAGGGARDVTTRRATLTGTINPHGAATTYHFNYGPTNNYGSSTPEADGGDADGDQAIAQQISGLLPDTTYHVQVVATTGGVAHLGADGLFRTAPAPASDAIGPTGITTDAATLAGELNTYGLTGSYHFDVWSLDSSYAISTGEQPAAGNASVQRVSAPLTGLPAGERFAVQLTVTSNDSIKVSDLLTFATADVPKVFPPSSTSDTSGIYGCASPRLNAYNSKPKPGDTIKITGSDLGIGANVMLGDRSMTITEWSASGFKLTVPDDAKGALALTIDCGHRSNTIALTVFEQPDNAFAVTARSVAGAAATVTLRLPGPGKIETSATGAKAAKVTVKKAGVATIKVRLTSAGRKTLSKAKSRTLKINARVRYTPAGGQAKTKTVALTFRRKASR